MEMIIEEKKTNKKSIDYDDILRNMGMHEVKGKLYWEKINDDSQNIMNDAQQQYIQPQSQNINNSYIYNKYFKNEMNNNLTKNIYNQQPKNIIEYRNMMIKQMIERKKIQQIKSTKMLFQK